MDYSQALSPAHNEREKRATMTGTIAGYGINARGPVALNIPFVPIVCCMVCLLFECFAAVPKL